MPASQFNLNVRLLLSASWHIPASPPTGLYERKLGGLTLAQGARQDNCGGRWEKQTDVCQTTTPLATLLTLLVTVTTATLLVTITNTASNYSPHP